MEMMMKTMTTKNTFLSLVLATVVGSLMITTVTGELLAIEPHYNPFWVLEDSEFSVSCSREDTRRTPLMWNINGMGNDKLKADGYTIREEAQRLGPNQYRMKTTISKKLTVMDSDFYGPATVSCDVQKKSSSLSPSMDDDSADGFGSENGQIMSVHMFSVFTEHPNISEGEDVVLRCSPDYEQAMVFWSREGHVLDNESKRLVLQERNRSLIIHNSRPQDSGLYQCKVSIEAGFDKKNVGLFQTFLEEIRVSGRPYLTVDAPSQVDGSINETLTITCPVTAFPKPEVYWLRGDDSPVEPSPRTTLTPFEDVADARLTISSLNKDDLGTYSCVAQNSVGRMVKEFKVAIGGAGSSSMLAGSGVFRMMDLTRLLLLGLCACLIVKGGYGGLI